MRFGFASLFAATTLALAATAQGQVVDNVKLTEPYAPGQAALIANFYYVSPYSGEVGPVNQSLASDPTVALNCVDFFHDVTIGEVWTADVTNLGAAAASGNPTAALSYTRYDNLQLYEEMAYLTTFYSTDGGNATEADAIQTAIWWLAYDAGATPEPLYNNNPVIEGNTNTSDTSVLQTGYWLNVAASAPTAAAYYNQFNILSGTGNPGSTAQEFIYSTPEPGTLVLLATGLLILGVGATRARRKVQGGASFGSASLA